jgi:hypothetical protein
MRLDVQAWAKGIVKYRVMVLILIGFVVTGVFLYGITKISVNVVLEDMFPFGHPFVKLHKEFGSQFGGASTVLIALKVKDGDIFNTPTLLKVKGISDAISFNNDAYMLLTASISERKMKYMRGYSGGNVEMNGLMWPKIPQTPEELNFMKENIFTNPLYNGVLVSRDGKATLIISEFKENVDYSKLFQFFMGLKKKYEDKNTTLHMIGKPVLLGWIYSYWPQMMRIFAVSIGVMVLLLWGFFRNWQGTLVPVLVGLICTIWGLGFTGYMGINLSPLLFVLPFLVGARALSHTVQITHRFFEEYHRSGSKEVAAVETISTMFLPNISAILAEVMGFSVIYLAKIVLMQQLAVIMSFWMFSIFPGAGILAPVICYYLPPPKAKDPERRTSIISHINLALSNFSTGKVTKGVVIVGFLLLTGIFSFKATQLKVGDLYPGSPILRPHSVYNQDYAEINKTFDKAGADNYLVFFRGNQEFASKDPKVLKTFEAMDRFMASRLPDIYGGSASLAPIVRKLDKEFHDGNPLWDFIPGADLCNTMLFLFQSKSVPGDMDRYADPKFYNSNILMFFKNHTEDTIDRIRKNVNEFFTIYPKQIDKGEFLLAGGVIGMETAVNEELGAAHVRIDSTILIAIFLMCCLTYRSFLAGFLLIIPLVISNIVAFGFMSFAKIGLSINTLPVSAVGVGVGVDFGIYLYSRYKEEYARTKDWAASIAVGSQTTALGVLYSALTLVLPLLSWYFFSGLRFQAQMGFLLALLLSVNMFAVLTLHPALVYVLKPKFISNAQSQGSAH